MNNDRQHLIDALNERLADQTLSFGCRVKMEGEIFRLVYEAKKTGWLLIRPNNEAFYYYSSNPFQIIGHTVTLARVLFCFKDDQLNRMVLEKEKTMDESVREHGPKFLELFAQLAVFWDCENDSLEFQSDPCLQLLEGKFLKK